MFCDLQSTSEEDSLIPKSEGEVDGAEVVITGEGGAKNTSSIGGASFNFINSIIGSGIIGKGGTIHVTVVHRIVNLMRHL